VGVNRPGADAQGPGDGPVGVSGGYELQDAGLAGGYQRMVLERAGSPGDGLVQEVTDRGGVPDVRTEKAEQLDLVAGEVAVLPADGDRDEAFARGGDGDGDLCWMGNAPTSPGSTCQASSPAGPKWRYEQESQLSRLVTTPTTRAG
jgi:hypothetical protein